MWAQAKRHTVSSTQLAAGSTTPAHPQHCSNLASRKTFHRNTVQCSHLCTMLVPHACTMSLDQQPQQCSHHNARTPMRAHLVGEALLTRQLKPTEAASRHVTQLPQHQARRLLCCSCQASGSSAVQSIARVGARLQHCLHSQATEVGGSGGSLLSLIELTGEQAAATTAGCW